MKLQETPTKPTFLSFVSLVLRSLKMDSLKAWISQHKLASISTVWASGIGASLLYTRGRLPLKPSLKLIHARLHAQALTLGVLAGAALLHYSEKKEEEEEGNVQHFPSMNFE